MRMYGAEMNRLPRRKVLVRARMRAGGPKTDICIRDVSARGLLIQANTPPQRGSFVEIMCEGLPITGQVIWISDRRFGVITRERLDVAAFVDRLSNPSAQPVIVVPEPVGIRVGARRPRTHGESRDLGNALQFATMVGACGAAAVAIAFALHGQLTSVVASAASQL